jgi:hypothetical protein
LSRADPDHRGPAIVDADETPMAVLIPTGDATTSFTRPRI